MNAEIYRVALRRFRFFVEFKHVKRCELADGSYRVCLRLIVYFGKLWSLICLDNKFVMFALLIIWIYWGINFECLFFK